jgi:hypothetical protein
VKWAGLEHVPGVFPPTAHGVAELAAVLPDAMEVVLLVVDFGRSSGSSVPSMPRIPMYIDGRCSAGPGGPQIVFVNLRRRRLDWARRCGKSMPSASERRSIGSIRLCGASRVA